MTQILLKLNNNSVNSLSFGEIKNRIIRAPLDKFIIFIQCPDIFIKNAYQSNSFIINYIKNIVDNLKVKYAIDEINTSPISNSDIESILVNILLLYLKKNKIEVQLSSLDYILNRVIYYYNK